MTVKNKLQQIAAILFSPPTQPQALQVQQTVMTPVRLKPTATPSYRPVPQPDIIYNPGRPVWRQTRPTLSQLLRIGSAVHPLCRNSFVEQVICGHYAYSRRIGYRTNPVAAIYVGAFGPDAIKEATFSYSMAVWRINKMVGYDITNRIVDGPTGRRSDVAHEIIQLSDADFWTREGIAEWLESIGL